MGISNIDIENKVLNFYEYSVEVGEGSFAEVTNASIEMINNNFTQLDFKKSYIGMEIPPVSGMFSVKLWALDTRVYEYICKQTKDVWLFNVPYLKFINGKDNTKQDTINMIEQIVKAFETEGFKINQFSKTKNGKDRKLTSNECDSFLYCLRIFVKYSIENGTNAELVQEIISINERFIIEKETLCGKHKK
jgi:hypothetical protein